MPKFPYMQLKKTKNIKFKSVANSLDDYILNNSSLLFKINNIPIMGVWY